MRRLCVRGYPMMKAFFRPGCLSGIRLRRAARGYERRKLKTSLTRHLVLVWQIGSWRSAFGSEA